MTTNAANLLGALATAISTRIDAQASAAGGRSSTASAGLVAILNHPDESIDRLRRALALTHSGTVRLINGLVEESLVERRQSESDGRSVVLRLTKAGKQRANRILRARAEVTEATLDGLSERELASLTPILESALRRLTTDADSARRICRLCDERVCRPEGCPVEQAASEPTP